MTTHVHHRRTAFLERLRVQIARLLLRGAMHLRELAVSALPKPHPMRMFLESVHDEVHNLSTEVLNPGPPSKLARALMWTTLAYVVLLFVDATIAGDSIPTLSWLTGHDLHFLT